MKQTNYQHPAEFPTRDIYLASVIKQSGIPLIKVESNGRQGIFVFRDDGRIKEIISDYFNDKLQINPKSLFETWKSLKAMAFSSMGDVR